MDIDAEFFALSTTAGSAEIYEPPTRVLEGLNVLNGGVGKAKWSIESADSFLYLKGERDTVYGVNKFIIGCAGQRVLLHAIFDAKKRDAELMSFGSHSLVIDANPEPISPISKNIVNGWFNSEYFLSEKQIAAIKSARSVGVIVQAMYGAPVFFGFYQMPVEEGRGKLVGLLRSCG
jgi:hypothetical protein